MAKAIVIIEDDAILLKMYTRKFEKDGFEVIQAIDGEEGLKKIEENSEKIGAVLLDIMLPKIDGFEVLKRIKTDPKTQGMPVILSTNLGGTPEDKEKGMKLGAADFLVKSDYTPAEIVEKVKRLIK